MEQQQGSQQPEQYAALPLYQCHKQVRAFKIADIQMSPAEEVVPGGSWRLIPESGGFYTVPHDFIQKHNPEVGGYFVAYNDGYTSYSPVKAFEEGYAQLETSHLMPFGVALELLKVGEKIARLGWNGKGMWLSMSGPLEGRRISADKFWSQNNADFAAQCPDGEATVLPCITMKTASGEILMGWLASQSDMLASDWVIVADTAEPLP